MKMTQKIRLILEWKVIVTLQCAATLTWFNFYMKWYLI